MKRKTILLIALTLLCVDLFAQEQQAVPWNVYIGVPVGTTDKTIFNSDQTYKVEMPYFSYGLSVDMEKSMTQEKKKIGLTIGYYLAYLHGSVKNSEKASDEFKTISRWYNNPEKGMNQLTAMFTMEGNLYFNTRFHFAIPFGFGLTYASACDKGMIAPCFSASIRPSYFISDQLAVFASYRWIVSPKIKFKDTALTQNNLLECGILYTLIL